MGTQFLFIGLYLLIVFLVIEIAVVLLALTGLEKKISRYQVISMLTGTGFTTDESQLIIDHPVRRRISAFLILFGVFSLAVMISALSTILADDLRLKELLVISTCLLFLLLTGKVPFLQKKLEKLFHYEMHKNLDISELPIKDGLYLEESDVVIEIGIEETSELAGKEVHSLFEQEEDITLLFIKRGEVTIRNMMHKETVRAGDCLILYGNKEEIEQKFLAKDGKEETEEISST